MDTAAADTDDLDTKVVEVLRVDRENELALLLVKIRGGQLRGRTRWSFFKDVPAGLLGKAASEKNGLPKKGGDESTLSLDKPQNVKRQQQQEELSQNGIRRDKGGAQREKGAVPRQPVVIDGMSQDFARIGNRVGVMTTVRTDQEQPGRTIAEEDEKRGTRREKGRPCKGSRDLAEQHQHQQQSVPAERELAGKVGGDSPTLAACTSTSMSDPEKCDISSSKSEGSALPAETSTDTDSTDEGGGLEGVSSTVPLAVCMQDLLEVKASCAGGKRGDSARSGEGRGPAKATATTTKGSAGLGVFCKRAVKSGDVVFKEEELLGVSKEAVSRKVWDVTCVVASRHHRAGVSAMDLLQAVAFDSAPPSVQARVLKLFAPDEAALPQPRREAWNEALDMLYRYDVLTNPASGSRVSGKGDDGRTQEGGAQGGGRDGQRRNPLDAERRSTLLKVLMICEANIFGELEDEGPAGEDDWPRSLFEVACRINHACLPNCGYDVQNGRVVVRASVDMPQGTELFVSYLNYLELSQPTKDRRQVLLAYKFFECHCSRCDAEHDIVRGFRCPRCHEGVVHPPNPDRITPRQRTDVGYGPALGTSACTACGRVPTESWLLSVCLLEVKIYQFFDARAFGGACKTTGAWEGLKQVYAAGVYMFAEHYLMCQLHLEMAVCLNDQNDNTGVTRAGEAAYHLHQMLVGHITMLGRPSTCLADYFLQLAAVLFQAGGGNSQRQLFPKCQVPYPSAGDCRYTYADLVQTPYSRRSVREKPEAAQLGRDSGQRPRSVVEVSDDKCAVCGRRHGDMPRPAPHCALGNEDEDELPNLTRQANRNKVRLGQEAVSQRLYLEGSQEAMRKSMRIFSAVFGPDSWHVENVRIQLGVLQTGVSDLLLRDLCR